jgi:purine-binding chemotaxis protein CheW
MSSRQDEFRVCLFELAGERFGVRLESVREVVPMAALAHPPCMPAILEGFLNLRGAALPVLRVARVLGLPQDRLELHTPLVVMRGEPLALLVNQVEGIVRFPDTSLVPLPASESFNGCVEGRLTGAGGAVHLLLPACLLLEKERQVLSAFRETEAARLHQIDRDPS